MSFVTASPKITQRSVIRIIVLVSWSLTVRGELWPPDGCHLQVGSACRRPTDLWRWRVWTPVRSHHRYLSALGGPCRQSLKTLTDPDSPPTKGGDAPVTTRGRAAPPNGSRLQEEILHLPVQAGLED
jgi:hypothetical protein